jgi:hypothetical protein
MTQQSHIQKIFFRYLLQIQFDEKGLDYSVINKHTSVLQTLSDIGNSGTGIFDLCKREVIFYSSNFGVLLGYEPNDYKDIGQQFLPVKFILMML